jgi:hypothetical protein
MSLFHRVCGVVLSAPFSRGERLEHRKGDLLASRMWRIF